MTAEEYYEKQRRKGLTEDITGDPEPDYSLPFYQNIFKIMEGYQSQLKELLPSDEEIKKKSINYEEKMHQTHDSGRELNWHFKNIANWLKNQILNKGE